VARTGKDYVPKMFVRSSDGRAAVKLGDKVRYCGKGDTLMSRARYHRLVSEWFEERARAEAGAAAETPSPPSAAAAVAPHSPPSVVVAEAPRMAGSPVDDWTAERTCAHLPPEMVAMVRLQRLSGARPDEACRIRPAEVNRSGDVLIYRPGMSCRAIYLGPKAAWLLQQWIDRRPDPRSFLFPDGNTGRPHTPESYARAVRLACVRLGIPPWDPMQLVHSLEAEILGRFGEPEARAVLEPARPDLWPTLAARDIRLARRVAMEIG
jgi:integrase